MKEPKRIAIANVGWSELYEGDALIGDHDFLRKNGWGAERYNFLRDRDGGYNVYLRPVGPHEVAPAPKDRDGWLIVLVSKKQNKPGLYIVGWFEDATFLPSYEDRPEYKQRSDFPLTPEGKRFPFDIVAAEGLRVPEDLRDVRIETTAMRRTSIMYLRGHGVPTPLKTNLANSVLRQLSELREVVHKAGEGEEDLHARNPISVDSGQRQLVETRSMEIAKAYFEAKGYDVRDVSRDKREFCDLIATRSTGKHMSRRLMIEVKGTQQVRPQFLMSRRERRFMDDPINNEAWRMLIVTSALYEPSVIELNADEVRERFDITPFTWFGREKP